MASAAQDEAREAIFKAIEITAKEAQRYTGATHSGMVRDAAYAWRALVGGTQPGAVVVKTD